MRRPSGSLWVWLAVIVAHGCGAGAPIGGIHARLGYSEEQGLRVLDAPVGGAAARAGLREGDRIIAIDNEPVREMAASEVVNHLRGPVGSKVQLDAVRDGEIKAFVIPREPYDRK